MCDFIKDAEETHRVFDEFSYSLVSYQSVLSTFSQHPCVKEKGRGLSLVFEAANVLQYTLSSWVKLPNALELITTVKSYENIQLNNTFFFFLQRMHRIYSS